MGDYKKITRSSLYDSESEYESNNETSGSPINYIPNIEFEFVEVDESNEPESTEINNTDDTKETQKEEQEEFEFPLFAASSSTSGAQETTKSNMDEDTESRGRNKNKVMKVSLREASVEVIKNERPLSYYMATYTEKDKSQFLAAAVTAEDIYSQLEIITPVRDPKPWKCIDLAKYNHEVEREIQKNKAKSKSRPGKKKRLNIIACSERKLERKKVDKKIQKELEAKIKKKMFHKRGGKKHKKVAKVTQNKPKYRTE